MVASEAAQEIGGLIAAVFKNRAMGTIFLWPSRLAMLGLRGIFTFSRSPWHGADRTTDDLLVTDLALLQPMRPDQEIQFLGPELDLVSTPCRRADAPESGGDGHRAEGYRDGGAWLFPSLYVHPLLP